MCVEAETEREREREREERENFISHNNISRAMCSIVHAAQKGLLPVKLAAFKKVLWCVHSDPNRSSTLRRPTTSSPSSSSSSRAGTATGNWPAHSPAGREYLELNSRYVGKARSAGSVGRGPRINECAFWSEYLPSFINFTDTGQYAGYFS